MEKFWKIYLSPRKRFLCFFVTRTTAEVNISVFITNMFLCYLLSERCPSNVEVENINFSTYLLFCSGGRTLQSTSYIGYAMMIAQNSPRTRYKRNSKYISHHFYSSRHCELCVISVTNALSGAGRYSSNIQQLRISYQRYQLSLKKDSNTGILNNLYCINITCTKQWVEL